MRHLVSKAKADGIAKMVVGAVILNEDKEILVMQRKANDFMGGLWELPSGTVDSGESLLDALEREVREETRLVVTSVAPKVEVFDYKSSSGKSTRQFTWRCQVSGDVKLSHEHAAFEWLKKNKLDYYNISRETKKAIRSLAV